jgi:hypothetical protein
MAAAVHFIAGHEGGADPARVRAFDQAASQVRLAGEHDLLRDAGQLAVLLISSAPFRQVQRPADQRMPAASGIGQGAAAWHSAMLPTVPLYWRAAPTASVEDFSSAAR